MLAAEHALAGLQHPHIQRLAIRVAALDLDRAIARLFDTDERLRMLQAQHAFPASDARTYNGSASRITALRFQSRPQIVQAFQRVGMLGPQHALGKGEGLLRERGCLLVFALAEELGRSPVMGAT